MADTIKTVNKTRLSNGEIRYYEDSFARENITELNNTVNDISVEVDTKQNKLIAGDNISIEGDVISASATSDYNKLDNKPTINGKEIVGDLSTSDLDIKTSELVNDEGFLVSENITPGSGINVETDSEGNVIISNTNFSAEWGNIRGNISDQQDLQDEFATKQHVLTAGDYITIEDDSEGNTIISTPSGDYNKLDNKPSIDGHTIQGNISTSELLKDNYYTKSEVDSALSGKQDSLTAGNRIDITNNTISFQDYTAGTGINIANDIISADTETLATRTYVDNELTAGLATKQDTLTPGSGIKISKEGDDTVIETVTSAPTWGSIEGTLANQTDLNNVLTGLRTDVDNKQDELIQGSNITIDGNTISAVDTKYTAGNGLSLTNNEFAIDDTVTATKNDLTSKQDKLTAGTNINISAANVISATGASWGSISGTLSDQTDLQNALNTKQDNLTAGNNISITGDTISATDTTYTAGNGLSLTGTEFSIDDTVTATKSDLSSKQNVLTAGTDIEIVNDVISFNNSTGYISNVSWGDIQGTLTNQNDLNMALLGKQDTIGDLSQIRSGAALGATSVQPNDNITTLTNNAGYISADDLQAGTGISLTESSEGNIIISNTQTSAEWGNIQGDISSQTDLQDALDDKVDKVTGMGLSQNSYTTTEKDKLAGIASGAQVNVIESISKNGTALAISNKNVDITVPTKTSDLTNDGNGATPSDPFATESDVNTVDIKLTNLETRVDDIIAHGGEPNTINHIQKNSVELPITNKTVNVIVPTKTSDLINDGDGTSNFATESYVTTGLADKQDTLTPGSNIDITSDTISVTGLANVATTGDYSDLSNAPTGTLTIQKNGTDVATFSADQTTNVTANISVPTKVSDLTNDTGFGTITEVAAGSGLTGGGTTGSISLGHSNSITAQTTSGLYPIKIDAQGHITEYGEALDLHEMVILRYGVSTWSDFIDAYRHNAIVYCRASSNSNPASGSQTRMAFMAYVNNADNPTNVEFQYYRSVSSHTFDLQGDEVYIYKLESNNNWSVTVRKAYSKVDTEKGLAHTFSGGTSSVVKLKANLQSETQLSNDAAAATEVAGRVYPVALDKSGYLAVNVPWADSVNDVKVNGTSILSSGVADLITNTAYDSTDNKIATMSDVSSMGTVKSVQVAATGPIQSSQNTSQTETLSTTISLADAYGDTKNPYGSKTKNFVLAAPSNANGTPSFRALTTADIPNITVSKISDFPTIPTKTSDLTNDSDFISDSSYVHTDNNFTTTLKNKLDGIAAGAEVNVQADWNETDSTSDAYIKNKPSIPEGASAGTTVTAVGTTAVVGTSTSFAREDHVHNITSSTITSALGFTPYNSTNPNGYQTASQVSTAVAGEATLRTNADVDLQSQIDALSASSDVVDVVGTYAELQQYDTSKLNNNDIVKVLIDSTHSGATGYYRWVIVSGGTNSWEYVGSEGPYYTVAETDALLGSYTLKTRKVGAVDLSADISLSGSFNGTSKTVSVSGTPSGSVSMSLGTGTANYTPSGSNAKSAVTISPKTTSVYSMSSDGSKTDGTAANFEQGTDSFTTNTPTVINTSKFNGGSFIGGTFNGGKFVQGTDTFVAPVLTFTPNSGTTGNLGISWSEGSFIQGSDSFTAATHSTDSFTPASLGTGFYTAGTAAKFIQGEDSFTPNTPTSVTLPKRTEVTGLWNGYNTGAANTYAAAQIFVGDGVELKGTFEGDSMTSTGSYKPEGTVTVTSSH